MHELLPLIPLKQRNSGHRRTSRKCQFRTLVVQNELVEDRQSKTPAAAQTAMAMEAARENRLLIGKGGMYGNVLRVSPPMNVGKSDVDQFVELLDHSLEACSAMAAGGVR